MSLKNQQLSSTEITPMVIMGASAVGIGGFVTKMDDLVNRAPAFGVQGASILSVTGGYSEDTVSGLRERERKGGYATFVSFDQIDTKAVGSSASSREAHKADVMAHAAVKKLRLLKRFEADFLEAKLSLQHPGDPRQPPFSWEGNFSGMKLDTYEITVTVDDELKRFATLLQLQCQFQDRQFYDRYRDRFFRDPGSSVDFGSDLPRFARAKYCMFSIVEKVACSHPDVEINGHVLSLKGFGAIHFGEMLVLPDSRQLTLAKVKLGCRDEGEISICDVGARGEFCPP